MNVQTLNALQDKSKERLVNLVENIVPKFMNDELDQLFKELQKKSSKNGGFIEIGKDKKVADLSKMKVDELKSLYQIFISREINDRVAVKWRLYQFLKYFRGLEITRMKINSDGDSKNPVDFVVETKEKELIFMVCFEVLDLKQYNKTGNEIIKVAKEQNMNPDRIIFAPNKTYRNLPLDVPIKIGKKEIIPELWVELIDD